MSSRSSRNSTNNLGASSSKHKVGSCRGFFSSSNSTRKTPGNLKAKMEDEQSGDEEQKLRRQKNREAAKRCRDKKIQLTEELQKKNEELTYDNRKLAEQKTKLIKKLKRYKREIEEHKRHGCSVMQTNDVYALLEPSLQDGNDDSSSFSGSLSSEDSSSPDPILCTSSTSGFSFPPSTAAYANGSQLSEHVAASAGFVSGSKGVGSSQSNFSVLDNSEDSYIMTSVFSNIEGLQHKNLGLDADVHYITVRTRDGSIKHLALRRAQYVELMNQMGANKQSQQQRPAMNREVVITRQPTQNSPRTSLTNSAVLHVPVQSEAVSQVSEPQHHGRVQETTNTTQAAVLVDGQSISMANSYSGLSFTDLTTADGHLTEGRLNVADGEIDRSDYILADFSQIEQIAHFLEEDSQENDSQVFIQL